MVECLNSFWYCLSSLSIQIGVFIETLQITLILINNSCKIYKVMDFNKIDAQFDGNFHWMQVHAGIEHE